MIIGGKRSLAHVEKVSWVKPIEKAANIEQIGVLGWTCISKIGEFKQGDLCVYIEIDSKVPEKEWSEFLRRKHFKIKTMKLGKFNVISQGITLPLEMFDVEIPEKEGSDVTELLEITYSNPDDRRRKKRPPTKYDIMAQRNKDLFDKKLIKWLMQRQWGKKLLFIIFGSDDDKKHSFPKKFPHISKTDQERCENMPEVLKDKTPYVRTQKCDGSSTTYILEKKHSKLFKKQYEFYVCSRNLRIFKESDPLVKTDNIYWTMAEKYDIEEKLRDYLEKHENLSYVCWQGEICGPKIQANPHKLFENHLFCFHMTDDNGILDIRDAKKIWDEYEMESVPIDEELYVLPEDFEEFKQSADGFYAPEVCDGQTNCPFEGWVYYKSTQPNFSFKNVSRKYLLKHNQ